MSTHHAWRRLAAAASLLVAPLAAEAKTVEEIGDWRVVCQTEPRALCAATHEVTTQPKEGGPAGSLLKLVLTHRPGAEQAQLLTVVPLGIDLMRGLTVEIDSSDTLTLPLKTCDQGGCRVAAPLGEDFIKMMQKGAQIRVGYWPNNSDRQIKVSGSLSGFTAAYAKIAD